MVQGNPKEKKPKPLIKPKEAKFTLSTDSLSRAAMAGIWHMQQLNPGDAAKALEQVKASEYGKELRGLAASFDELVKKQDLANKPELALAKKPEKAKHEAAWTALELLQETVRIAWVFKQCRQDEPAPYHAELRQMLLGNVQKIKENQDFKKTEAEFLHELARQWQEEFNKPFWLERDPKLEPIDPNPYIFAEAYDSSQVFVGRKRQLEQLKNAWRTENFQNVLLFGPRRSGKTALLHKADVNLREKVDLVHVNLAQTLPKAGVAELFLDITGGLGKELGIPSPEVADMMHSPMRIVREFIHLCSEQFGKNSLVIVFDNFESLENILPNPIEPARVFTDFFDTCFPPNPKYWLCMRRYDAS